MTTMQEKGTISIDTENIFPIIKKFLYSDNEIFLRELVSNAVDATQKLKSLATMGEFNGEIGETKIVISLDKENKTITVSDKGIGMTADEIKKYINQIAFSGATEFLHKYKDKADTNQLIGHFGLGFYSAFMVAERVEIITKSYKEGSEAARWSCTGNTEFEITTSDRTERGTDIILHLSADAVEEFGEAHRLRTILDKYCRFLPIEIEFGGNIINSTVPIWTKTPSSLTDEDYKTFYKALYPYSEEPLFWIHLNVDYPFNLTGILYFPKIKKDLGYTKDKIQLYSRQVFITDDVKEIVPDFLTLLHGVIDSPDIPLNVSRSFLQSDANVKKINTYITKKVAEKLFEIFRDDRKGFEEKWDYINMFVKYGMITDDKFREKAEKFFIYKNLDGKYYSFEEYEALIKVNQTDKNDNKVILYTTDAAKQDTFIQSAKKRGYDVVLMDGMLDSHFLNTMESKLPKTFFKRVDADILDKLIDKGEEKESVLTESEKTSLKEIFDSVAPRKELTIEIVALPTDELPITIVRPEFLRRMKEMASTSGMGNFMNPNEDFNIMVNANHSIVSKILKTEDAEARKKLAKQALDLGLLSQGMLRGTDLTQFIERSVSILGN